MEVTRDRFVICNIATLALTIPEINYPERIR